MIFMVFSVVVAWFRVVKRGELCGGFVVTKNMPTFEIFFSLSSAS
jgi:hypothetical protein